MQNSSFVLNHEVLQCIYFIYAFSIIRYTKYTELYWYGKYRSISFQYYKHQKVIPKRLSPEKLHQK